MELLLLSQHHRSRRRVGSVQVKVFVSSEFPSARNRLVNPSFPRRWLDGGSLDKDSRICISRACGGKTGIRKAFPAPSIRCASPSAGECNLWWLCNRCTLRVPELPTVHSFRRLEFKAQAPFSPCSKDQAKKRIFDELIPFYHLLHQIICKLPSLDLIILVY